MAVDNGYRMFDTAWLTATEEALGKALKDKIRQGVVSRKELYIITKLWCTSHATDDVVPALKRSLQKLQMDYVDLFLVHFPMSMPASDVMWPLDNNGKTLFNDDEVSLQDTWKGMEECVKLGLTKSIGISSFKVRQIKTTLECCTIKPAVHQIECHPYFANKEVVDFCHSHNIHIMCFSPMGKPNRPWAKETDPFVATDPTLIEIGKKYGKKPGQVALRYQYQRGNSVIPKSGNDERQKQNMNIFDFELSSEDMERIINMDRNFRVLYLRDKFSHSKEYPFDEV